MKTAFVTGATGFVGSNLVKKLLFSGWYVYATGNNSEQRLFDQNLTILQPCLSGLDWGRIKNVDAVFHLAANNDTLSTDRQEMMRANVSDTSLVFMHAFSTGCKNFVYASSGAVYGKQPPPFVETLTPNAVNVYGESKIRMEKLAEKFASQTNVTVCGLRFSNVYGPGESHKGRRASMVTQLAEQMNRGGPVRLFKDGSQKRDWIHVDDAVDACMKAANFDGGPGGRHEVFNVASGESIDFLELVLLLRDYFGLRAANVEWIDNPHKESYQDWTEYSIEKGARLLDWHPFFSIRSGVKTYLIASYGLGTPHIAPAPEVRT